MLKLSVTQIEKYLACQYRHKLSGREYIRPVIVADDLRKGINWHDLQEIIGSSKEQEYEPLMELLTESLNIAYADVPYYKNATEWEIERNVLFYAIAAYLTLPIRNFGTTVLDTDIAFRIPVLDPATGKPVSDAVFTGKLDEFGKLPDGTPVVPDYKSTSLAVDDGSDLWLTLGQSMQSKFYVYILQRLQKSGKLLKYGLKLKDALIRTAFYSVWKKPGISPKRLTQKESADFLETGHYLEQEFVVTYPGKDHAIVDGVRVEAKPGKKADTFALKESPQMYGLRLYNAMIEDPDSYFNAKTFTYTDADIALFEVELFDIYKSMKFSAETDTYTKNRKQCRPRAGFGCDFCSICDHNVDITKGLPDDLQRSA